MGKSSFATNTWRAIHGKSQPPHLHRVYKSRHRAGVRKLSRCTDKFLVKRKKYPTETPVYARTDSREFQMNAIFNEFPFIGQEWNRFERETGMRSFLEDNRCSILGERFIIYGTVGRGTYGVILAARERQPPRGRKARHYALKVERHAPSCRAGETTLEINEPYKELEDTSSNAEQRYVPKEAIVLRLLSTSDRFPKLDSVYVHKDFQVIVMSADSLDEDPLRNNVGDVFDYPTEYKFPGYPGTNLMQRRRKGTKLNEVEGCKVASQLLEALVHLMDMNIVHGDLSHRNYLVDKDLNVQLIDLGLVKQSLDERSFGEDEWAYIPAQEYQMSPELAIEMSKPFWLSQEEDPNQREQLNVLLPHDSRVCMVWKFGVLVYDLLHGNSPWEDADDREVVPLRTHPLSKGSMYQNTSLFSEQSHGPRPEDRVPTREDILARRHRIINNELPIDENLTQDCHDVLQAMFQKNPRDRPTLQALCSFPWFQGWWVDEGPFTRPGRTGTSPYPSPSARRRNRR